jgi:hypothetical protein
MSELQLDTARNPVAAAEDDATSGGGLRVPRENRSNAFKVMEFVVRDMPPHYFGTERQEFITRKLEALDDKAIKVLRVFYEHILKRMRDIEASDIDIGSFGTRGHIWFRVHGNKLPQNNLPELASPYADVLIQSLVLPKQRLVLLEQRSLDFSYQTIVDGEMYRYAARPISTSTPWA